MAGAVMFTYSCVCCCILRTLRSPVLESYTGSCCTCNSRGAPLLTHCQHYMCNVSAASCLLFCVLLRFIAPRTGVIQALGAPADVRLWRLACLLRLAD
jgi:hypothetical protein